MDPFPETPDVETMAIQYLKANAGDVGVAATKIASELPANATFPYVVVFAVRTPVRDNWEVVALLQVDAWGTSRLEARTIARAAVATLTGMNGEQPGDYGVVTDVKALQAARPLPDPVADRRRYSADVQVTAHALQRAGS